MKNRNDERKKIVNISIAKKIKRPKSQIYDETSKSKIPWNFCISKHSTNVSNFFDFK